MCLMTVAKYYIISYMDKLIGSGCDLAKVVMHLGFVIKAKFIDKTVVEMLKDKLIKRS